MGKPTGFMDYNRVDCSEDLPSKRIEGFAEFKHLPPQEEMQKQAARCMDCGVPFCQSGMVIGRAVTGCPLHNLIPEWNDLMFKDKWKMAYYRLKMTNNFPEFTGRVCPAPCEKACVCNLNGEAVTSHNNELAIIEKAYEEGWVKPAKIVNRTDKKVAVIGSGPSGLAVADSLNKRGHNVTVYERNDRVGGLLMYGIPNMKLDKSVVDRKVNLMKQEGVQFICNTNVGIDISGEELLNEYDAVVLCCGASLARDLKGEGREGDGIYFAVDYLKSNTKHLLDGSDFIDAKGKDVLIVGGGDTGNDAVGTAIRQKASSVLQFEMMDQPPLERLESNPWPQWPNVLKTDYGQQEAIYLQGKDPREFDRTIESFVRDGNGKLIGVNAVKISWDKGQMIKQEVYFQKCDMVIIAAGFLGAEKYVADSFNVELSNRNTVVTTTNLHQCANEKIFSAGDMHRGQSLVVWAIREGRQAAYEVDSYLMGYTNLDPVE